VKSMHNEHGTVDVQTGVSARTPCLEFPGNQANSRRDSTKRYVYAGAGS
jgi:hypothetical protein